MEAGGKHEYVREEDDQSKAHDYKTHQLVKQVLIKETLMRSCLQHMQWLMVLSQKESLTVATGWGVTPPVSIPKQARHQQRTFLRDIDPMVTPGHKE